MEGLIVGNIDHIIASLPNYCKLSGSRALGVATDNSDYDFYVPENKWTEFKKWASENISPNYTSVCTGQIAYYVNKVEHNCLIEFSYLFPNVDKRKEKGYNMSMINPYHSSNPKIIGGTLSVCPKCKMRYNSRPAISRVDNKTKICPMCGQKEALEAFKEHHEKMGQGN